MKRIKIIPEHRQQIETALSNVNGKATKYVISTYEKVLEIADRAERKLKLLSPKSRTACIVHYTPRGPLSRKYRFNVISTRIMLRRSGKKGIWFLTYATPETVHPGNNEFFRVQLSHAAKIERMMMAIVEVGPEISLTAFVNILPGYSNEQRNYLLNNLLADQSDNPTVQSALDALNIAVKLAQ